MAKNNNQSSWTSVIIGLVAFGLIAWGTTAGIGKIKTWPTNQGEIKGTQTQVVQAPSNAVSYQGQEGKTALELLQATHKVETEKYSFGEMVISIDGQKATTDQFWSFYINGQLSEVGADAYQTKSGDTIEWRLESF